ncbi:MAG: hypothetical protein PHO10_05615 [Gemmiger sp.]|nr:hypothetical protein [Gemmiger sp.]
MLTIVIDCVSIGCLLLWGWWLCRVLRLPASFGPVLGTAFCMVALEAMGGTGYGVLLLLVGAAFTGTRGHRRDCLHYLCSPGVLAFMAGCVALGFAFSIRAPRFQTWDEFSHWGIFFKNVFYNHRFALWEAGRSLGHQSYPQGGAALYALFAFFRPGYAERDVFFAMDIPLLAGAAALFGVVKPAGRRACALYRLLAIAAVPLMLVVFAPDTPYTTAYMDAAVGVLFGAGLALLLLPPAQWSGKSKGLAIGLLAAATATLKEIGTVFALCLLGIWLVQCLLAAAPASPRARLRKTLAKKAFWLPFLAAALPAGGSILFWKIMLLVTNRATDQFSSMGIGHFFNCLAEARSGADPYFYNVWAAFYAKVRTAPLLFGWSTLKLGLLCGLLSLLLGAALLHFGGKRRGGTLAAVPLLMAVFFPCYLFVLFYVYMGGMSPYEALQVASYARYACCFFIAWFGALAGAGFALCSLLPRPGARVGGTLALAGVLAVNGVLPLAAAPLADAYALPYENWRDAQIATAGAIRQAVNDPDAALWLLSADADTAYQTMWYYQYELYPDNTCIEVPSSQDGVDLGYNFEEHGIQYLVLFGVTDDFATQYAPWATDGFAAARAASPAVYAVTKADGGNWVLAPVL